MTAATLVERGKNIVRKHKDDALKLQAALDSLRRLEERRREIIAFNDAVVAELASYQEQEQSASAAYSRALKSGDVQQVREALREWLPLRPLVEFAQRELGALNATRTYGGDIEAFKSVAPNAKEVLLAACQCELSAAKADAEQARVDERARLSDEFDESDVASSPVVRRQAAKVSGLEAMLHRIETESIETTWKSFAEQLLSEQ